MEKMKINLVLSFLLLCWCRVSLEIAKHEPHFTLHEILWSLINRKPSALKFILQLKPHATKLVIKFECKELLTGDKMGLMTLNP